MILLQSDSASAKAEALSTQRDLLLRLFPEVNFAKDGGSGDHDQWVEGFAKAAKEAIG